VALIARARGELSGRERLYRGDRTMPSVAGKAVIVVDDGLATGATMQVAVAALRTLNPLRIIAAAPVGSTEACATLRHVADACLCSRVPEPFFGVGRWYEDFSQTSDDEVLDLLRRAATDASGDRMLVTPGA
jgi:putative phosphoribosyl transferase